MRASILVLVVACVSVGSASPPCRAQESVENSRKLLVKVIPDYPELARKGNLSGSVKMLVTVSPNGTVKKIEIFGGSPVLAQAAERAVQKWKWQRAPDESKEPVELNFHPD